MPMIGTQVTVATTPTLLVDGTTGTAGSPIAATVRNNDGSASIFLGGSAVTTGGYELKAGISLNVALLAGDSLYACTSASTVRADVLKSGQ